MSHPRHPARPISAFRGNLTYRGDLDDAARATGKKTLIGTRSIRRLLLEEMARARRRGDREAFTQAWQELAYISIPPGTDGD